ncbi:MAG: hypothetical protein ACRDYA_24210, partial [Egibacteraceae bacterium]
RRSTRARHTPPTLAARTYPPTSPFASRPPPGDPISCAGDPEFNALCTDLIRRGRAAGIIWIGATQKPSSDVVPTSLRDLVGITLGVAL